MNQGALFDIPTVAKKKPAPEVHPVKSGPHPWDPIDAADIELGWQYRWVSANRAREIREELSPRNGKGIRDDFS